MERDPDLYETELELRRATLAWCERRFRKSWGVEWSAVAHVIDGLARWDAVIAANEKQAADIRDRLREAMAAAVEWSRMTAPPDGTPAAIAGTQTTDGPVAQGLRRFVADARLPVLVNRPGLTDTDPHEPGKSMRWRLVRAVHFADWGGWTARAEPFSQFSAGDIAVISILSGNWPNVTLPAKVEEAFDRERKSMDRHLGDWRKMTAPPDWDEDDDEGSEPEPGAAGVATGNLYKIGDDED